METREIKFGPLYRGRDSHQTPEGSSYNLINVYRTRDGTLRKRPGYALFKDFAAARPITLLWASPNDNTGVLVARNSSGTNLILDWVEEDGTVINVINATNANLLNNIPIGVVSISSSKTLLSGGNGTDLVFLNGWLNDPPTVANLTAAPPNIEQYNGLTFARDYVLAASVNPIGTTYFNNNASGDYSIAADWRSYTNHRKPDAVYALFNIRDEIANLGADSVEFAWLDGTAPWAEIDGSYSPYGVYSLYSTAQIGDVVYFLSKVDKYPKVVRIGQSHQMEIISDPIDAAILGIPASNADALWDGTNGSALGQTLNFMGIIYYVMQDNTGSTELFTLLYDSHHNEWFRWSAYSSEHLAWPLKWIAMPDWDYSKILASDLEDTSKIYTISEDYLSDAGTAIRCELESGNIAHGTLNQKRCEYYRFFVKRVDDGSFTLYVNDENAGWDAGETVSLDPVANAEYVMAEIRNVGVYRNRRVKLVHSSATDDFELVRMEEGFTVLRS